jgi:hypothetical protein
MDVNSTIQLLLSQTDEVKSKSEFGLTESFDTGTVPRFAAAVRK